MLGVWGLNFSPNPNPKRHGLIRFRTNNPAVRLMEQVPLPPSEAPPPSRKLVSSRWRTMSVCLLIGVFLALALILSFQNENVHLRNANQNLTNENALVRSDYDAYVEAYQNIRKQINFHSHPYATEDVKQFVTPTDSAVVTVVTQITGGWSSPNDWNEFWSDVKKLYDWVKSNVTYAKDQLYPYLPDNPLSGVGWVKFYPTTTYSTEH